MSNEETLQLFEDQPIRTAWSDEEEEWYFAIVDVVGILSESADPQTYWRVLKKRLKDHGNQTVTNCNALKLKAADGKRRLTDVATTEQILRMIQSIKKTEINSPPHFASYLQTLSDTHHYRMPPHSPCQ